MCNVFVKDLLNDLEDELGGHFLDLALALYCPAHLYDAHLINKAISVSNQSRTLADCLAHCRGLERMNRHLSKYYALDQTR